MKGGGGEKRARFEVLVTISATLDEQKLPETRLFIAGTFSQIQLDIYIYNCSDPSVKNPVGV